MKRDLSVKEFNDLVKFFKRLDDIGDDFFLINDMILPSIRTEKNRPGKHVVKSRIPTIDTYDGILYGIAKLEENSKILGDVKGKKTTIYMEQNETGIWITINDLTLQLAGIYDAEGKNTFNEIASDKQRFDDYVRESEWTEIPYEELTSIKKGNVLSLEDSRGTTYTRIARDLFKLRGVSRLTAPVDHTAFVNIVSPVSEPDTIVIGSNPVYGQLAIHVIYPIIECIHYYTIMPFH